MYVDRKSTCHKICRPFYSMYSILNSSVQLTDLANCVIFFKTGFDKFYWQCILSQLLNFIVYTYPPTLTAVLRGCVRE